MVGLNRGRSGAATIRVGGEGRRCLGEERVYVINNHQRLLGLARSGTQFRDLEDSVIV